MPELKEKLLLKRSLDHVFFSNPVLVGGLVIGQLAAGATNLQNGVALTVTFFFVTLPVLVFAAACGRFLPRWSRIIAYMLISGAMLFPAYLVCRSISPTILDSVGVYLPLLAVSTVPALYSARFSESHPVSVAFLDGVFLTVGFGLVAAILGAAREFFGSGSLWGVKLASQSFHAVSLPFWGFILLGFMAAGVSGIRILLKLPDYVPPVEEGEAE